MEAQKRRSRYQITRPDTTLIMNDGSVFRESIRTGNMIQVAQHHPLVAKPEPKNRAPDFVRNPQPTPK